MNTGVIGFDWCHVKINHMNLEKHVQNMLTASIIGIAGLAVSHMSEMSRNIQVMTVSIQELNTRMGHFDGMMKDHELRLREIEHNNSTRR